MSTHSPCSFFPVNLHRHLSNTHTSLTPLSSAMEDILRFSLHLPLKRNCPASLSSYSLTERSMMAMNANYIIHFMIGIFENRISNKPVTFLLNAAEPPQWECVWSPADVSLVIVNLSPLVSTGCSERNQRACAEVVRSLPFPLISPCGTSMNAAASTRKAPAKSERQLRLRWGQCLTRQVWTFKVIK